MRMMTSLRAKSLRLMVALVLAAVSIGVQAKPADTLNQDDARHLLNPGVKPCITQRLVLIERKTNVYDRVVIQMGPE